MSRLPKPEADPSILVGYETADDAAAVRLDDGRILLQSVDFFTPIVDDPYQFGQIAAANALSDIYAMGGKPLFALNIVGFPKDELPLEVLSDILRGGADKAHEAGIHILGGHTIDDKEPKYGMVITGEVEESSLIRNSTAKTGDILILTKPLGTGIIATAIKHGSFEQNSPIVKQAVDTMITLNKSAAEAATSIGVNAMTDVTGFGLLGHLHEMLAASGCAAKINYSALPFMEGVMKLAEAGRIPGGTKRNLKYVTQWLRGHDSFSETELMMTADAQTSGGLLISVSEEKAETLLDALEKGKTPCAVAIGQITDGEEGTISLSK